MWRPPRLAVTYMHSDFIEAFLRPSAPLGIARKFPNRPRDSFLLSFPSFFPSLPSFLASSLSEVRSAREKKEREGKERGRREKGRCTDHGSLTLEAVWLSPWLVFERSNYSNEGAPRFYVHHKERHIAGVTGKRGASRCSFFRPRIERLRLGYEERDGYTRGFRAGWLRLWEFISARARHDEKKNVWMGQRFIVGGGRIESCL